MKEGKRIRPGTPKFSSRHPRQHKIRLLPDILYLRWDIELLSAITLIVILIKLPGWTAVNMHAFFPKRENYPITHLTFAISNVLIIGFSIYIFLRILWFYFSRTKQNPTQVKLHYIGLIDQAAELLISVCVIILVVFFFAYAIFLLISYLQNELPDKISSPYK